MKQKKGFTLIELIIVVAIIALLAAATFVAVNPAKRIGDSQNAQRWADVTAIADAWSTYVADNSGSLPTTTNPNVTTLGYQTYMVATSTWASPNLPYNTCAASTTAPTNGGSIVLKNLVDGGYIGKINTDPTYVAATHLDDTRYYLYYSSTGSVTVGACTTYNSAVIKVTR